MEKQKQSLTTTSTAESELVTLSDMTSLLFHMEKFLIGQGCTVAKKIMYQDNATTIHMLTTEKHSTMRNAHIGSKYYSPSLSTTPPLSPRLRTQNYTIPVAKLDVCNTYILHSITFTSI
jgi:hypothetical protein